MFENIHNWPLEHWHIELCSKCTLKCPRCSRQEVPEGLTNKDLTLELIGIDYLKNKDDFEINLIFTNNAHISLQSETIEVRLEDQNEIK